MRYDHAQSQRPKITPVTNPALPVFIEPTL